MLDESFPGNRSCKSDLRLDYEMLLPHRQEPRLHPLMLDLALHRQPVPIPSLR